MESTAVRKAACETPPPFDYSVYLQAERVAALIAHKMPIPEKGIAQVYSLQTGSRFQQVIPKGAKLVEPNLVFSNASIRRAQELVSRPQSELIANIWAGETWLVTPFGWVDALAGYVDVEMIADDIYSFKTPDGTTTSIKAAPEDYMKFEAMAERLAERRENVDLLKFPWIASTYLASRVVMETCDVRVVGNRFVCSRTYRPTKMDTTAKFVTAGCNAVNIAAIVQDLASCLDGAKWLGSSSADVAGNVYAFFCRESGLIPEATRQVLKRVAEFSLAPKQVEKTPFTPKILEVVIQPYQNSTEIYIALKLAFPDESKVQPATREWADAARTLGTQFEWLALPSKFEQMGLARRRPPYVDDEWMSPPDPPQTCDKELTIYLGARAKARAFRDRWIESGGAKWSAEFLSAAREKEDAKRALKRLVGENTLSASLPVAILGYTNAFTIDGLADDPGQVLRENRKRLSDLHSIPRNHKWASQSHRNAAEEEHAWLMRWFRVNQLSLNPKTARFAFSKEEEGCLFFVAVFNPQTNTGCLDTVVEYLLPTIREAWRVWTTARQKGQNMFRLYAGLGLRGSDMAAPGNWLLECGSSEGPVYVVPVSHHGKIFTLFTGVTPTQVVEPPRGIIAMKLDSEFTYTSTQLLAPSKRGFSFSFLRGLGSFSSSSSRVRGPSHEVTPCSFPPYHKR